MKSRLLHGFLTVGVVLVLSAAVAAGCVGQSESDEVRSDRAAPPDRGTRTEGYQGLYRDGSTPVFNDSPASGLATPTLPVSDLSDGFPARDRGSPGTTKDVSNSATEPGVPSQMGLMGRLQKAAEFKGPVADARAELDTPVLTAELHNDSITFTVGEVPDGIDRTVVELDNAGLWMAETAHDSGYIDIFIVPVPAGETVKWRAASVVIPAPGGIGYAFGPWTEWSVLESPPQPPDGGVTRAEVITVYPDSRWADLMVSFSDAERRCIQDSVGEDFERVMTLPVVSGGDAQQHEVDVFGCLAKPKAGRLFVAILEADSPKPVGASEEICLTELLARTDLAEVYRSRMRLDGNGDGTLVTVFSANLVECLGAAAPDDVAPQPGP